MKFNRFRAFSSLPHSLRMFVTPITWAQTNRAQIRGFVIDASSAALPNATVTLKNLNTGLAVSKATDSSGLYVFDFVDPGTYTITVEATGFGKVVQENVVVQAGGDVTVNATMNPGTLQQSVTVSDTPPAVEFNSANQDSDDRYQDGERYTAA